MPIQHTGAYPPNWLRLSKAIKTAAGWKCERCHHLHDPQTYHTLTTHHIDGNKSNQDRWNLAALCQRCHLYIEQFDIEILLLMFQSAGLFGQNEDWLTPHINGIIDAVEQRNKRLKAMAVNLAGQPRQ